MDDLLSVFIIPFLGCGAILESGLLVAFLGVVLGVFVFLEGGHGGVEGVAGEGLAVSLGVLVVAAGSWEADFF